MKTGRKISAKCPERKEEKRYIGDCDTCRIKGSDREGMRYRRYERVCEREKSDQY